MRQKKRQTEADRQTGILTIFSEIVSTIIEKHFY